MRVAPFAVLDPASYREIVRRALAEDVRWGDVTTEAVVPAELTATGAIVLRTPCVLAGLDVALECFRQLDPHLEVDAARREGERCESGTELARVRGRGGRVADRGAQRVELPAAVVRDCDGDPGLRRGGVGACYGARHPADHTHPAGAGAVRRASGWWGEHRVGLDDGVLIGTNHVRIAGGVQEAVRRMRAADAELPIEVEVRTLEEVDAALEAGVAKIRVAGLSVETVQEAVRRCPAGPSSTCRGRCRSTGCRRWPRAARSTYRLPSSPRRRRPSRCLSS